MSKSDHSPLYARLFGTTSDPWHLASRLSMQIAKYCILNGLKTNNSIVVDAGVAIRSGDIAKISTVLLIVNNLLPNDHQQVT